MPRPFDPPFPFAASPGDPPAGSTLHPALVRAFALQKAKDYDGAENEYRRFLRTHPTDLMALNNAALVAKALGRRDVALLRLGKAIRHHPQAAEAHFNLANTLQELGRLEEAIPHYQRALALRPDYAKAHLNLGNVFDKMRRFEEASACYRQALAAGGDDGETHANLGQSLKQQGRILDGLVHLVCAAEVEPERAAFHFLLASAYHEIRSNHAATLHFRRVLEIDPGHAAARSALLFQAQRSCDFAEMAELAPLVRAATDAALAEGKPCDEGALESVTRDPDPRRNQGVAVSHVRRILATERLYRPPPRQAAPRRGERIRIGYLSHDFCDHPVAHVFSGVFARHDRSRFDVTAYSYGPDDGSHWRRRVEADADRFVDLRETTDDAAARRIHEDGTDILIDLTLWTLGTRPLISAVRPAPVQIQYLGFPGTSGAPYYDYAIADNVVVPPESRRYWSEHLIYMPDCYFPVDRDLAVAESGARRADHGLPEGAMVFCSFNQSHKIEPIMFGAWMRILAAVPGSLLWLGNAEPVTETNLRREATARGVEGARLIFAPRVEEKAQHLERLGLADLALDTLIYNGHTTSADALWAGTPLVTVEGTHYASRASASLLRAVGLEELITRNIDDFVALAVALAGNPAERQRLRAHLAAARATAPLFDTARTVANLERAYQRAWDAHLAGAAPADIEL